MYTIPAKLNSIEKTSLKKTLDYCDAHAVQTVIAAILLSGKYRNKSPYITTQILLTKDIISYVIPIYWLQYTFH